MFFNKNVQNLMAALNDLHEDMAGIKTEFGEFRQQVRQEIDTIKQDYRDLIQFLEEDNSPETAAEPPKLPEPVPQTETPAAAEQDAAILKAVTDEIQQVQQNVVAVGKEVSVLNGDLGDRIVKMEQRLMAEIDTFGRRIEDAKKDIKNKISYTVGRLKV